jgi:hypothetical protein
MPPRQREEVINVLLAECICESGMNAAPETIERARGGMPDVIVSFRGLRCVIEGKYSDVNNARDIVLGDATSRVEAGIAHMAIAVVYPAELRTTAFADVKDALRDSRLEVAIVSEAGPGGFRIGNVGDILDDLRRSYDMVANDDVVARSVELLERGMRDVIQVLTYHPAACDNLALLLGVYEPPQETRAEVGEDDDESE